MTIRKKDYDALVGALVAARADCACSFEKDDRLLKLAGWYITVSRIRNTLEASYTKFSKERFYTDIGYYG